MKSSRMALEEFSSDPVWRPVDFRHKTKKLSVYPNLNGDLITVDNKIFKVGKR
jgi:hypothetical protein